MPDRAGDRVIDLGVRPTPVEPASSRLPASKRTAAHRPAVTAAIAAVTTVAAAAESLVLVVLFALGLWATDPRSAAGAAAVLRVAGAVWLAAHGAEVRVPGAAAWVSLVPLGLTALVLWLLARRVAGLPGSQPGASRNWTAGTFGTVVATYAVFGWAVALASAGTQVWVPPGPAALGCALVATIGFLAGRLLACRRGRQASGRSIRQLPHLLAVVGFSGVAGISTWLACGAGAVALALVVHAGPVLALTRQVAPTPAGVLGTLLLELAWLPDAAIWGAAYLTGPGVVVGRGARVSLEVVRLHRLPGLPILAALPVRAVSGPWELVPAAVLICSGIIAGAVIARRRRPGSGPAWAAASGLLAGLVAAAAAAGLAALAGGSVGHGALEFTGPPVLRTSAVVAVGLGLGAALVAAAAAWRDPDRRHPDPG